MLSGSVGNEAYVYAWTSTPTHLNGSIARFFLRHTLPHPTKLSRSLPTPSSKGLPTLPKHLDFGSLKQTFREFLAWILAGSERYAHDLQSSYQTFTSRIRIFQPLPSVYASGIPNETNCTASGSGTGSTEISCLNHAANVFIYIAVIVNDTTTNVASVSGVTVGGFTALQHLSTAAGTKMTIYTYYFSSYSANDSVVATFSGDTGDAEAMVVADWTGTRNTLPFLNSLTTEGFASATSSSVTVVAGDSGRTLLMLFSQPATLEDNCLD